MVAEQSIAQFEEIRIRTSSRRRKQFACLLLFLSKQQPLIEGLIYFQKMFGFGWQVSTSRINTWMIGLELICLELLLDSPCCQTTEILPQPLRFNHHI
ncbi:hypothetical protein Peur_018561 [Populus x canadensis]